MNKKRIVLLLVIQFCAITLPGQAQDRASWMKGQWGIMTHYLSDWISQRDSIKMDVVQWNNLVDHFDAEGLASQVASLGAHYYIISIGQNSGYYISPNPVYDKLTGITPGKCSRRDLVADIARAMLRHHIRTIVYLPSGAPAGDRAACLALQWKNGPIPYANKEFQVKWEQIIREWSVRWGDLISGWWFDGCYWPNEMYRSPEVPNFSSFAAAARAGNPNSIVAFNPGVIYRTISITPEEDYLAGEIDKPELITVKRDFDGKVDGTRLHILSFLGNRWGGGTPRFQTDQVINWSRSILSKGGAFTWDVPIQSDGLLNPAFIEQLTHLGQALNTNVENK